MDHWAFDKGFLQELAFILTVLFQALLLGALFLDIVQGMIKRRRKPKETT